MSSVAFATAMTSLFAVLVADVWAVGASELWQTSAADVTTSDGQLNIRHHHHQNVQLQQPQMMSTVSMNETRLSDEEIDRILRENDLSLRPKSSNFNPPTQAALVTLFVCLIVFGAAGNGLVCYVVVTRPHMRSPRNILILNLAASDLILCCFTQPFNLMKVRTRVIEFSMAKSLCHTVYVRNRRSIYS
jgi:hypothetical protein